MLLSKGGMRGFSRVIVLALIVVGVLATDSAAELAAIAGDDGVIRIVRRSELAARTAAKAYSTAYQLSECSEVNGRRPKYAELSWLIMKTARKYGLDPAFVMALVKVESNFNPCAISPKGARGLMQLMPATARMYGLRDYYDPAANADAGVRHLSMLLERYDDDVDLVLAAYNAGSSAVDRYGGIPPYGETVRFIRMVKKAYLTFSGRRTTVSGTATFSGGGGLYRSLSEDGTIVIRGFPGRR